MSDQRPVIGVAAPLERASYSVWHDGVCALLQISYIEAIQRAGGLTLIVPPDPSLIGNPDELLSRIDALLLAGGNDVDPSRYHRPQDPHTHDISPVRDQFELALLERAISLDLPTLCICRGMQLLNVACGGTLAQHLPDVARSDLHRHNIGTFEGNQHAVALTPGSLAARAAGPSPTLVSSHHHQGIDLLGDGLLISGRCVDDQLPEAIELPEQRFLLGVQWHPEADPSSHVIAALVKAATPTVTRATRHRLGDPPPAGRPATTAVPQ